MILNCFTPSRTNGIIIISKVGERYLFLRGLFLPLNAEILQS